ncbi:MAG: hypothetical protein WBN66_11745 [Smithella sp.]
MNIALTFVLLCSGLYLLGQDAFFIVDRWNPEEGTHFQGVTLYYLAFGILFLAAFAGIVTYSWIKGTITNAGSKHNVTPPVIQGGGDRKVLVFSAADSCLDHAGILTGR